MFDKLRQQALQKGMKLLSNPKVMKLMADPRFMNALMRGMELKGKVQSDVEATLRNLAARLNLVTRDELSDIKQSVHNIETQLDGAAEPKEEAAS